MQQILLFGFPLQDIRSVMIGSRWFHVRPGTFEVDAESEFFEFEEFGNPRPVRGRVPDIRLARTD